MRQEDLIADKMLLTQYIEEDLGESSISAKEKYIEHGHKLLDYGVPLEEVQATLSDLYWATANEYGG